jgi:hypothetical protein
MNKVKLNDKHFMRAYQSYTEQLMRCRNPRNKRFSSYGAKGIQVKYERYEFLAWWTEQLKTRPKWKQPTVGRKDHNGHYEFGNIQLEEMSENSKEMRRRVGTIRPLRPVLIFKDGARVLAAESVKAAAAFLKCGPPTIVTHCKNGRPFKGYNLCYQEGA